MKKLLVLCGIATLLLAVSCKKTKDCRCAVLNAQDVRILTISRGSCSDLNYVSFRDDLDTVHIDSIICTDFPFAADTTIRNH